jgi:hypothetical protein
MNALLLSGILAAAPNNITWYLIPLAFSISLVYTASRYEETKLIITRTTRLFLTILVFMAGISLVLLALSMWL